MKKILVPGLWYLLLVSCGQKKPAEFPDEIVTQKKSLHINIPGTRVFIVPPEDFYISDELPAIQNGKLAVIQAVESEKLNFYTNSGNLTEEQYKKKGIKLLDYKDLKLNGDLARIALFEKDETNVYNFTFGDSSYSVMVVAVFQSGNSEVTEQVRQALLSVYYDKQKVIDPLETAYFELDDSQSTFKFAKFGASVYMYSAGGVKKVSYENEPHFMVLATTIGDESLSQLAESMAEVIDDRSSKNVSSETVNGLRSYKREVYGKKNGKPTALFQHIVLIGDKAIIMQGITDNNFNHHISEFRKLSETIKTNPTRRKW